MACPSGTPWWCVFLGLCGWVGWGRGAVYVTGQARPGYSTDWGPNLLTWQASSETPIRSLRLTWQSAWGGDPVVIGDWYVVRLGFRRDRRLPLLRWGAPANLDWQWTLERRTSWFTSRSRLERLVVRFNVSATHDWAGVFTCHIRADGATGAKPLWVNLGLGCVGRLGGREPEPALDCGPRCPGTFRGPLTLSARRLGENRESVSLELNGSDDGRWARHATDGWTLVGVRGPTGPLLALRPLPFDTASYEVTLTLVGRPDPVLVYAIPGALDGRTASATWARGGACVIGTAR